MIRSPASKLDKPDASFSPKLREINLFEDTVAVKQPGTFTISELLDGPSSTTLLWKNEQDRAEALIFAFAQRGVPQQVFRWTGWSGNIKNEDRDYTPGLTTAALAFQGVKGFHLFGGTQTRSLEDGALIPNTCDIPIALRRLDSDLVLIGVIPKVDEEPKLIPNYGIVLRKNDKKKIFTVINPDQNIGIVLQPDVNGKFDWIDEIKESLRISSKLADKGWATNLVVYGGTVTEASSKKYRNVEQELIWWAKQAQEKPDQKYNIILLKGSGGVADKYANDPEFLKSNPCVKVFNLDYDSIRAGLAQMPNIIVD